MLRYLQQVNGQYAVYYPPGPGGSMDHTASAAALSHAAMLAHCDSSLARMSLTGYEDGRQGSSPHQQSLVSLTNGMSAL